MQEDDERVHDERDREERCHEDGEELRVADERFDAALADGVGDKPEDAEGSEADDPLHDLRHGLGEISDRLLRRVACRVERDAREHGPGEDADVVRRHDGVQRVVDNAQDEVVQNLDNAARRRNLGGGDREMERRREQERIADGDHRSEERADDVKAHDGLHGSARVGVLLRHGVHDEHEDENGRDTLERLYEEVAEDGDCRNDLRQGDGDDDAEDESDGDELDQGSFLILSADGTEQRNSSFNNCKVL